METCQNTPKMMVWGKITPLKENFQNSSIKVQERTSIHVFLQEFHPNLSRYKFFAAILRPFGLGHENFNTRDLRLVYICL